MLANPRTFRCPNCNEMINDSMTECRYCSTPVDPGIAAMIADRQEKTNRACSDASYLKTAAIAMMVFLGLSVPHDGLHTHNHRSTAWIYRQTTNERSHSATHRVVTI